jgi:hypothetical protein
MKTKVVMIASILIAPLAFGQARADDSTAGPRARVTPGLYKAGTVDSFLPGQNITITSSLLTHPAKYIVSKDMQFENGSGGTVSPRSVQPGTRVKLEFNPAGQIDRIILLDLR